MIAQLSDLHVTPPGDPIGGGNRERLEEAVDAILDFGRKPDLIVVTGDIAEHGDIEILSPVHRCDGQSGAAMDSHARQP